MWTACRQRLAPLVLVAGLAFVLGGLVALIVLPDVRTRLAPPPPIAGAVPRAAVGGPFTLVDHTGRRVTDADFRGRHLLMVFGSTRSADATPAALQLVALALSRLGPKAERVVPLLVSLDPERDAPGELAAYVARFHRRLIGLTGTPEEVAAAARAWHVHPQKVIGSDRQQPYILDVPALIYLMGPNGDYITHFGPAATVDQLASRLAAELS